MKNVFVSICMAGALAGLSSCASSKDALTVSSINGEWNIIEINGTAVVPAPNKEFPFIGFDTATGRVSGNSGCNRMMGSFDVNAKPGAIDLGALASTRMACPDMALEKNVLSALAQVKKYKKLGKDNIALCGSSNRPIVVLQKRTSTAKLTDLGGRWMIAEVGGQTVAEGMENQPFVEFNLEDKRIHANAGCNGINGGFVTDDNNSAAISFPQLMSTMKACPDMDLERRLSKSLREVKSFGKLANGNIGLYDANKALIVVLKK